MRTLDGSAFFRVGKEIDAGLQTINTQREFVHRRIKGLKFVGAWQQRTFLGQIFLQVLFEPAAAVLRKISDLIETAADKRSGQVANQPAELEFPVDIKVEQQILQLLHETGIAAQFNIHCVQITDAGALG